MHVAHLERTGHYLTIKDNQIVQVSKWFILLDWENLAQENRPNYKMVLKICNIFSFY